MFRIGHLGDLNELMVLATLAGTEMAMLEVGIPIKLGSGNQPSYFIATIGLTKLLCRRCSSIRILYEDFETSSWTVKQCRLIDSCRITLLGLA